MWGTYHGWGYTYLGQGGTYHGWGYLPWIGCIYLGQRVPTLDRGYLCWTEGYLPWMRGTYLGQGVSTLSGGASLGYRYLPCMGVPTMDRGTYLGQGGTYHGTYCLPCMQGYLPWTEEHLLWKSYDCTSPGGSHRRNLLFDKGLCI